jgi:serine/threonine protein phosphatase PrpC
MATTPSDPNTSRAGGLLARLKGLVQTMKPNDDSSASDEVLPTWDVTPPPPPANIPTDEAKESAPPVEEEEAVELELEAKAEAQPDTVHEIPSPLVEEPTGPAPILCPVCAASRKGEESSCGDCGYYFSPADLAPRAAVSATANSTTPPPPATRLKERYEIRETIGERLGTTRYRGLDHGDGSSQPVAVVIVRQSCLKPALAEPVGDALSEEPPLAAALPVEESDDEVLPMFDEVFPAATPIVDVSPAEPAWPSIDWEQNLLAGLQHPGLPAVLDRFTEGDFEYLVEEVPAGRSLWDAWDDQDAESTQRFDYLAETAEIVHRLHQANATLEGVRPEIVTIAPDGHARLNDLSDLLPLPLPAELSLRRTLYTAPELLEGKADARAALYSFGAMLYALHVGRDVNEIDFDRSGSPKPFIPRFPDIHPAFGRLMSKTFRKDVEGRFPSDEASKEDATGLVELIRTLRTLGRTLDNVRLEIAAWTTTGMVRTGNEDAFALLHACESRQDDLSETALLLLCDGMGGYEAGEVAAALAIQIMRQYLVKQKPFAPLSGASSFPRDFLNPSPALPKDETQGHAAPPIDVEEMKKTLRSALKEANKQIYAASRAPGSKRRGMGCTAEAVYIDGRNLVVGHVGDSRTYHLHEGRLIQITRDQTLVNRLVELGTLSPEEAETHPRRNELQQAVGGQPDVEPGVYSSKLKAGDWIVVCSDGLTNHVTNADLEQMLRGEGYSAETVARRLVNLANLQGATDNATVVVVRVT